ncbi:MAG: ribonuclease R family protein [Flavobacteriales bacterium]
MSKRKRPANKKGKKKKNNTLTKNILSYLRREHSTAKNYKQIAASLNITDANNRNQLIKTLRKLQKEGSIQEIERGKFTLVSNHNYYTGTVDLTTRGQGYVMVDDLEEDIFISNKNLNKAFQGDTVEVYIFKRRKRGKTEGEITKILNHKQTEFVGVIDIKENFAFVNCQDSKLYTDFFIPKKNINNAQDGDKVLVKLIEWPNNADSPFGKVIQILGKPGEHQTEIHSILAQYGLPYEFPKNIEQYANEIDTSIKDEELKKRRDMRQDLTFTIDPKDAKDFDDALSFKELEDGNYEIGIHIADVSHYLQEGTILDDEAFERATSVYLVDRVVPMLPEVLSNNACSLRPLEEKYTFSAVFILNNKAEVLQQWFGRTVTYSDARFAYEEAQHIIETNLNSSESNINSNAVENPTNSSLNINQNEANLIQNKAHVIQNEAHVIQSEAKNLSKTNKALQTKIPSSISLTGKEYTIKPEIAKAILKLDTLAKKLRKKRMHKGAISFDKVEVKFKLDTENNPEGVYFKESKEANKLIEEFMLLANRSVAEFIGKQKPEKTFVYRVHDEPDDEKIAALENIIKRFGYQLNTRDRKTVASSLNKLLIDVHGKKEQNLIDTLAIRSMSKAVYTTQNIGHYGLAFDYYTHFTSPIRRYPDVMAHRLLQHYLEKGTSLDNTLYEEKCKHCSEMENLATKAERDSIKYMQVKYMQDHKNQEFLGVISGVTEWGIYVEIISNKCEGMVRLQDIQDDHYIFIQEDYAIEGQKTKKTYQLGDEVYVQVKNADLVRKHLDFSLLGSRKEIED